jgi:hypothetical protein
VADSPPPTQICIREIDETVSAEARVMPGMYDRDRKQLITSITHAVGFEVIVEA